MVQLTKQQMLTALRQHATDGSRIQAQFRNDLTPWPSSFATWEKGCESTLEAIYGTGAEYLSSFKAIRFIPPPGPPTPGNGDAVRQNLIWFDSGMTAAINALEAAIYSIERLLPDPVAVSRNVFVSHGGSFIRHVDGVAGLLEAAGLRPIVVMREPNLGMGINEKVRFYMGICAAAVVLATEDEELDASAQRTRPNVDNEVGMLQQSPNIHGRIVLMKEKGVRFASNYGEKVWIPFDKKYVQNAFVPLIKDLRAFGML